jgi:hypothetical protein
MQKLLNLAAKYFCDVTLDGKQRGVLGQFPSTWDSLTLGTCAFFIVLHASPSAW